MNERKRLLAQLEMLNLLEFEPERMGDIQASVKEQLSQESKVSMGLF